LHGGPRRPAPGTWCTMPDPLADRLTRFTPDAAGLDRDGLLFAAGRASARPNRIWKAVAALLAVSQVVVLILLWPRPVPLAVAPVSPPVEVTPISPMSAEPGPPLVGRNLPDLDEPMPRTADDSLVPD